MNLCLHIFAVSIQALLYFSVKSNRPLSMLILPPTPPTPPNVVSDFPNILLFFGNKMILRLNVWLSLFTAEKAGRPERTSPDYHALWYFLQKVSHKYARSHKRAQLLGDPNY